MTLRVLRRRRLLLALALSIALLLLVVVPLAVAYASVHPSRCTSDATPAAYGLSFERVTAETSDGVTLRGWIVYPAGPDRGIVFVVMHGYTSCKADSDILAVSAELASRGYPVVAFDFRAHGESGGDISTIGPREARFDAPAIVSAARSHFPDHKVVLLGYSMGAVVALMSWNLTGVDAIVADSPYPLLKEVIPRWLKAKMGLPEWYSRLIGFYGGLLVGESLDYGPMKLAEIDKPVLVVVGTNDPLITPDEARAIAAKSCCGQVHVEEGAGHVEIDNVLGVDAYVDLILGFLEDTLGGG